MHEDCPTQQDIDDKAEELRQEFEEKFEHIERLLDRAGIELN